MTARPLALLLATFASLCSSVLAQDRVEASSLDRPDSPVIVQGARLGKALGVPLGELRVFSRKGQALAAIPYQIDERTHDEGFAYELGRHPLSDTDELLDANDELLFMARDVGDRVDPATIRLGQESVTELRIFDPVTGAQGWVYLLRYTTAPPPPSAERYLTVDWREGEFAGWAGPWAQVSCSPEHGNLLHFSKLQFVDSDGELQPDVLDRAKLGFKGSYLFLDIKRNMDEVRAQIISYVQGPIRLVASLRVEAYLIWDHWVRSTRGRLKLYANRLELELELELPVPLETKSSSELRFSLDFLPRAGRFKIRTNTNGRGIKVDGKVDEDLRGVDFGLPRWIHAALPQGAILSTLRLDPSLSEGKHRLFLKDGPIPDLPEDAPGSFGNVGYELDLTGRAPGRYGLKLVLQFGRAGARPQDMLRVDDVPLSAEATP